MTLYLRRGRKDDEERIRELTDGRCFDCGQPNTEVEPGLWRCHGFSDGHLFYEGCGYTVALVGPKDETPKDPD